MPEEQIKVQLNPDVPPTGSDLGICNAARKSFGRRSEWEYEHPHYQQECILKEKDKRLLKFLARGMTADDFYEFCGDVECLGGEVECLGNEEYKEKLVEMLWQWRNTPTHDTPFNHGFFSFEVKAPIFVRAQLVKHEYLIMSEYSRRYITEDVEFYQPTVWRKAAEDVKQGSSDEGVAAGGVMEPLINQGNRDQMLLYTGMLKQGFAAEQARMVLPQSLMTSWTWSGTLGAFAKMCQLRLAKDSQYETRLVAKEVYKYLCNQFPVAAPLLVEGVR